MRWYRFGTWMARIRILLAAPAGDLLWHLLGPSWVVGMLALLVGVTSLRLNSAQVQAQAAHQRLNVLVPQVTTIGTTANNALPKAGGTITGGLNVNAGLAVAGNHSVGGNQSVTGTIQGNGLTSLGNVAANGSIGTNGVVAGGTVEVNGAAINIPQAVGGWPMASSQAWGPSVVALLNATAAALGSTHVLSV